MSAFLKESTRNSRFWYGYSTWLNQGQTSECVAYSWSHFLVDSPTTHKPEKLPLTPDALYHEAQKVDEFPGENYDGTSVRAGAKVLSNIGVVGSYHWATSLDDVINCVLEQGPVVVGTNWYEDMFRPVNGFLKVSGALAGGHAWKIDGVNKTKAFFRMKNSWGRDWGNNGFARITFEDFSRLLAEDGEACIALEA